jgi:hypothetical protein
MWGLMIGLVAAWSSSAAASSAIGGKVTDQNGKPVERVQIRLSPGNVELVTSRDGRFEVSYLRDETGERVKLTKRQEYRIEVFKLGYNLQTVPVSYRRGVLEVEVVTLVPETLRTHDLHDDLDAEGRVSQAQGDSREGQ